MAAPEFDQTQRLLARAIMQGLISNIVMSYGVKRSQGYNHIGALRLACAEHAL